LKKRLKKFVQLLKDRDKGTIAISFLLSLPILMLLFGILAQFALLANARLTVDRAAAAAARSAIVALPTDPSIDDVDGSNYVYRSARMILETLSPKADSSSSEADEIAAALQNLGNTIPDSYARRYSYAEAATSVEWQEVDANNNPIDPIQRPPVSFANRRGQRIKLTVHYKFNLGVAGINRFIGYDDDVAGVSGRFVTISSFVIVQTSPGRQTNADGTGWPN
jgi:hypothetical protein